MTLLLAITIGFLYASALFMILRPSLVKLIFGLSLLSHGTNLLIFTTGGLTRGHPPLIPADATTISQPYADPIAQALVLTAIVISFAVLAFAVVLLYRVYQTIGTENMDMLRAPDKVAKVAKTTKVTKTTEAADVASPDKQVTS